MQVWKFLFSYSYSYIHLQKNVVDDAGPPMNMQSTCISCDKLHVTQFASRRFSWSSISKKDSDCNFYAPSTRIQLCVFTCVPFNRHLLAVVRLQATNIRPTGLRGEIVDAWNLLGVNLAYIIHSLPSSLLLWLSCFFRLVALRPQGIMHIIVVV